jgi:23S rRNA (pseudouridine1915-N3)-methyltransferase
VRVQIVAVGKIKEPGLREVIDEYLARARRHVAVDEVELKDAPSAQVGEAMARKILPGAHVVAMAIGGRAMSSEAFAAWLDRAGSRGKGIVSFLIGGADGLPEPTVTHAHERLSLSAMTLPHRIARVVLAEQIYRATAIWRGEPYHK